MKFLDGWAAKPESINFRRWENGKVIGHTALGKQFQADFDIPYLVVHRAHFHEALVQRALQLGVDLKLGSKVVQYEEYQGAVVLENGKRIQSDLVVAADGKIQILMVWLVAYMVLGIKSIARDVLHPDRVREPHYNGFAAYRATVDVEKMKNEPELAWILEKPSLNIWYALGFEYETGLKLTVIHVGLGRIVMS